MRRVLRVPRVPVPAGAAEHTPLCWRDSHRIITHLLVQLAHQVLELSFVALPHLFLLLGEVYLVGASLLLQTRGE